MEMVYEKRAGACDNGDIKAEQQSSKGCCHG